MKVTEIEKLNQLVSRTDMSGNEKVEWLTDFIDKHVTEQLRLNDVSISLARAEKYARMQHFLGETGSDFIEFNDWKQD